MKKQIFILTCILLSLRMVAQPGEGLKFTDHPFWEEDTVVDPFCMKKEYVTKSTDLKLDSIFEFDWSIGSSAWLKLYGTFHSYDENRYLVNTTGKGWISSPGYWQNNLLQEYYYDAKGNREKDILKVWSTSNEVWLNFSQRLFAFNPLNNLTGYVKQKWDGIQSVWENDEQYLYGYDEDENWTYYERQDWNPDSLRWENNYRLIFEYVGGLKMEMVRQNWNALDSTWVNDTRNIYAYDDGQNLIEEMQTVWQAGSESWIESTKISYTRDQENQVIEKLYQAWITGVWKNTTLYTYQYSSPGKESEYVYHIWDTNTWKKISRHLKEYDESDILILETDQQWQDGDESWLNDYQWKYFSTHFADPLIAYISDSTNISCHGFTDGTATVTISGGVPPYNILWNDPLNSTTEIVFGLSANRYYTVTVTDAVLNTVMDSVILSEPEEIITGPIYGESMVDQYDTVTYWVESDPAANYSWFVMHGQILSSQAGDTVMIIWTQPGQGKVSVIESNSFGCEGDTVHLTVSVSPTGIESQQTPSMKVYPNPANQFVIIQFNEKILDPWDLEIFDMTGKIIRSLRSITENRYQLSLDEFSRGIYFFKISSLNEIKIQKVIIEK